MIPYILTFTISIILISIGNRLNGRFIKKILIVLGLLLPCLLAGFRDISVGTDTKGYIYNLFVLSKSQNSFKDFLEMAYRWYLQKDYLYLLITYLIRYKGLSFSVLLFIYESLVIIPIYCAFIKLKFNQKGITIGLLFFFFILFNVSLNMLRQSIAISFCTLAFSYHISFISTKNKKEKYLSYLFLIIACGFHSTAIITTIIMILYRFYNSNHIEEKNKELISIIIIGFSLLIVSLYKKIFLFIGTTGIYPLALYYLNHYSVRDFSFYQAFINLLMIYIVFFNKKIIKESNYSYKFLHMTTITNLLISSGLGYFILYSQRIMLYLQFILLFCFFPKVLVGNEENKKSFVGYALLLIISWIFYFAIKNVHETIPYVIGLH